MIDFLINLQKSSLSALLMLVSLNALGWNTGVESSDYTNEISGIPSCSAAASIDTGDGQNNRYRKGSSKCDFFCHRWGLKWQGVWDPTSVHCKLGGLSTVSWAEALNKADPDGSGTTRLPTIKELVIIFDYTNVTKTDPALPIGHDPIDNGADNGTKGTIFRSWLQAENGAIDFVNGYLISSTYRNIAAEGGDTGDASPKILGIEIETGKVVAFDQELNLCTDLTSSGTCVVDDNSDGDGIDRYDVDVYAFKVSELPQ